MVKLAEEVVVLGERTFTLEHLDDDGVLVVGGGGEADGNISGMRKGT